MRNPNVDLGHAIKELREALGMRQEDLARAMNASRSFIAQVETGRMAIPDDRFPDLAAAVIARLKDVGRLRPDPAVIVALRLLARGWSPADDALDHEIRALIVVRETARLIGEMTQDVVRVALAEGQTTLAYIVGPLIGLTLAFPDEQIGVLINAIAPPTATETKADAAARVFQNVQLAFAMAAADHFVGGLEVDAPALAAVARRELVGRGDLALKRAALREVREYATRHDLELAGHFVDALVDSA